MKAYIVWNADKSEGFVTTDYQLAYEVRKGCESNCYDEKGRLSRTAVQFCDDWYYDDCTIEEIEIDKTGEK